ncbi:MAG: hypothetical protein ATN36_09040 [Epulopiscium sp. Nele67-Bin005]|nr:MAG: hypothetical protein ATN36_09040 [Epulopiscium sp. Nele67-Bin005]
MKKVIVIGAGASGLVSAILLARNNIEVTLVERLNSVGKKLLATGNGRCNLSNTQISPSKFHSSYKGEFFLPIERFGLEKTLQFFEELGIIPLVENNKVYPLSEQATSVVDVLRLEVENLNIKLMSEFEVNKIIAPTKNKPMFIVEGVQQEATIQLKSENVIVATGGLAGIPVENLSYNFISKLGHTITPLLPTLVHLSSSSPHCKYMQGVRVQTVVKIYEKNKLLREEKGEVLFTKDGLSGPPIFQVSRVASICLQKKSSCYVTLDLCPNYLQDEVVEKIYTRITNFPTRKISDLLVGWINSKVASRLLKDIEKSDVRTLDSLDYTEVEQLAKVLKSFKFEIISTRDFKFAQSTIGGVKLEEVDLNTMKSKIIQGLYFTGEVLDVDGDCGGYNLQWAWSTAFVASEHIISEEK